ncbi:MAG: Tyrosine recombinase XerC [Luteibacter sp.]|uniref:tyrosine-type recombinase/integrase n=1 Tax=Luteibacter sp. TaxID=1886636 RepID=UPI001381E5F8|nr:site-specific integrase [Luteibacter sp.]KAF1006732.1 MAG: Tyrosine recombinase XerC [Luteibacter sp.]
MASIYKLGKKWRAQVSIRGVRETEVFATKQQASAWAMDKEAAGKVGKMPNRTLGDALRRFAKEVSPGRPGETWEVTRCNAMCRLKMADILLKDLDRSDLATWRDTRLKTVKPATVLRDINLLRSVFKMCAGDWQWMHESPLEGLSLPKPPGGRRRRITKKEIEALKIASGMTNEYAVKTATDRTMMAFHLALETAMRSSEILGLTWANVDLRKRVAHLPKTKNGDSRDVPLSTEAVTILKCFPKGDGKIFDLDDRERDALWRKVRDRSGIENLHFHDSRAEAIWRLSKKLDVMQLARAIGHRDLKSLMLYYEESAEDMAKRLD